MSEMAEESGIKGQGTWLLMSRSCLADWRMQHHRSGIARKRWRGNGERREEVEIALLQRVRADRTW